MKFLRHETTEDTHIAGKSVSKGTPYIEIEGRLTENAIETRGNLFTITLCGTDLRRLYNVAFNERRKQKPGGENDQ